MKNKLIIGVYLLITGMLASAQTNNMDKMNVIIESQSKYAFTETIDLLSKTITENGWKVIVVHNLQETMKKNGKEVLPVSVIELCSPKHAYEILSKDEYRDVSSMLPCRISIYEKSDGKTYLSRMNAPAFAAMIGGDAAGTVVRAYNDTEEMIKTLLK